MVDFWTLEAVLFSHISNQITLLKVKLKYQNGFGNTTNIYYQYLSSMYHFDSHTPHDLHWKIESSYERAAGGLTRDYALVPV